MKINKSRRFFFSIYSEAAGGLKGGLMKWMHGCREVKRTSFPVMLQRKMKIKHSGRKKIYASSIRENNRESRAEEKRRAGLYLSFPGVFPSHTDTGTQSYLFSRTLMIFLRMTNT